MLKIGKTNTKKIRVNQGNSSLTEGNEGRVR